MKAGSFRLKNNKLSVRWCYPKSKLLMNWFPVSQNGKVEMKMEEKLWQFK